MKIRNGFVSNSSSSSFILFKDYMSPEQIRQVRDWDTYALTKEYFEKVKDFYKKNRPKEKVPEFFERDPIEFKEEDFYWEPEGWSVQETNQTFDIGTDMDNYDFEFFLKVIGVDIDKMGLRTLDHHNYVLGLNDARTDIRDYVTDPYYFEHYSDEYWLTSKYYREKMYKFLVEMRDASKGKMMPPAEPKEKKIWICEDAGRALREVEHEVRMLAIENRCYFLEKNSNGEYRDAQSRVFAEVLDAIRKVEDNWKATDDFEEKI